MVARLAGASFGLLAFTIAALAGLIVGNPVEVTLSRSIFALFIFCLVGFLLGGAARKVVAEYEQQRTSAIRERYREHSADEAVDGRDGTDT